MKFKKLTGLLAVAAVCAGIGVSPPVLAATDASGVYTCDFTQLVKDGADTYYGSESDTYALDDYTTAVLTYDGTYVSADAKVYLKGGTAVNSASKVFSNSYIAFTAPSDGTVTVSGADIGFVIDSTYQGYGASGTYELEKGQVFYMGYRKASTYVSALTFTPSETQSYECDFTQLVENSADTTYGEDDDIIALDSYTTAYLTYTGTYVSSDAKVYFKGTTAINDKTVSKYADNTYITFTAPSYGTVSITGYYMAFIIDGTYKGYSSKKEATTTFIMTEGQTLYICYRSSETYVSALSFEPSDTPVITAAYASETITTKPNDLAYVTGDGDVLTDSDFPMTVTTYTISVTDYADALGAPVLTVDGEPLEATVTDITEHYFTGSDGAAYFTYQVFGATNSVAESVTLYGIEGTVSPVSN